jgi:hypothetical protein
MLPWLCIPLVQLPVPGQVSFDDLLDARVNTGADEVGDAFSMKVAAESLELGRQQDRVRAIDLLSREATSRPLAADRSVGLGHLVEGL